MYIYRTCEFISIINIIITAYRSIMQMKDLVDGYIDHWSYFTIYSLLDVIYHLFFGKSLDHII